MKLVYLGHNEHHPDSNPFTIFRHV
jgi:hypothetical protein